MVSRATMLAYHRRGVSVETSRRSSSARSSYALGDVVLGDLVVEPTLGVGCGPDEVQALQGAGFVEWGRRGGQAGGEVLAQLERARAGDVLRGLERGPCG